MVAQMIILKKFSSLPLLQIEFSTIPFQFFFFLDLFSALISTHQVVYPVRLRLSQAERYMVGQSNKIHNSSPFHRLFQMFGNTVFTLPPCSYLSLKVGCLSSHTVTGWAELCAQMILSKFTTLRSFFRLFGNGLGLVQIVQLFGKQCFGFILCVDLFLTKLATGT